jgi:hypothetical protein
MLCVGEDEFEHLKLAIYLHSQRRQKKEMIHSAALDYG